MNQEDYIITGWYYPHGLNYPYRLASHAYGNYQDNITPVNALPLLVNNNLHNLHIDSPPVEEVE